MIKTKIFTTLIISACTVNSFAQLSAVDFKSDDYAQFKASKTYYLQTGDAKFDSEMAAAMKDLWKITPSESIDEATFKTKIADKSASFIVAMTISTCGAMVPVDNCNQSYHYLALINGGEKKLSKYAYDDMLAYCPINHWQDERKNTDCYYRVRNMIESMIQAMEIVQKNDIHGNSKKIVEKLQEVYNAKAKNIKDRTLLFCEETLGKKLTKSDVAGIYPHKFEICDKAKIEQVIKDKSKEYYYFQPTITLNKSMFVFDPSNGEVVYFDYQMSGMSITKGNIEDMANAIKGIK